MIKVLFLFLITFSLNLFALSFDYVINLKSPLPDGSTQIKVHLEVEDLPHHHYLEKFVAKIGDKTFTGQAGDSQTPLLSASDGSTLELSPSKIGFKGAQDAGISSYHLIAPKASPSCALKFRNI